MGLSIFETPQQYRTFTSDDPNLVLNRGYDAYIYTGVVNANWIFPRAASRFGKIKVICDPGAAQIDLQVQGGANEIKNPAPTNSLTVFPGVSFEMVNENKEFWLPTT